MNATDYRTVATIKRMLAKNIAQSAIARKVGVSPATVSRINLRMLSEKPKPEPITLSVDDDYEETKPYRCKECGRKVNVVPCMICWALAKRRVG